MAWCLAIKRVRILPEILPDPTDPDKEVSRFIYKSMASKYSICI